MANVLSPTERSKLETYLRGKLNPNLVVKLRQRADECAEIYLGPECLGVVQKIVDEGETSYSFEISVLQDDLR